MFIHGAPVTFQTITGRNRPPHAGIFLHLVEAPGGELAVVQDQHGVEHKTYQHLVRLRWSHERPADAGATIAGPVLLIENPEGLSWLAFEDAEGRLRPLPSILSSEPTADGTIDEPNEIETQHLAGTRQGPRGRPYVRVAFLPLRVEEANMIRSALVFHARRRGQREGPKVQTLIDKLEKFARFSRPDAKE